MYSPVDPSTWGTPSFAVGYYNYPDESEFLGKLGKKIKNNLKGTKLKDVLGPTGPVGLLFKAAGQDKIANVYSKVNQVSTGVGAAYLASQAGNLTGGNNKNGSLPENTAYAPIEQPEDEPEMEDLIPGIKNQHAAIGGIFLVLIILGTIIYNR